MVTELTPELGGMPPLDKLTLIGLLWDSIPEADIPVPESHQRIIDERLAEINADPNDGQTLDEFVASERPRR